MADQPRLCPSCDEEVPADASTCQSCGETVPSRYTAKVVQFPRPAGGIGVRNAVAVVATLATFGLVIWQYGYMEPVRVPSTEELRARGDEAAWSACQQRVLQRVDDPETARFPEAWRGGMIRAANEWTFRAHVSPAGTPERTRFTCTIRKVDDGWELVDLRLGAGDGCGRSDR